MLRGLSLGELASLVLLKSTLIEFNHAALVMDSLMVALRRCRQLIALRVIGNDRRRTAFHIVMMILITSHISIQRFSALTWMTVTRHLPLYKIRIYTAWLLLLRLKTVRLLGHSLLS